ncbi:MAG: phosphoribosyltransferase family protein [Actinomycetota bacterium]
MRYRDRSEAGSRLADALVTAAVVGPDERALVLGVPRGGVPVAAVVAEQLDADLDVLVAHKLGAPGNPEYAIGAVAEDGTTILDEAVVRQYGIPDDYIEREIRDQRLDVERRAQSLRGGRPAIPVGGRICVVVDDGVATGATLEASLRLLLSAGAERIIAAIPVGPPETIRRLSKIVDAVVCPVQPQTFFAVGGWYERFDQVPDAEVIEILERFRTE